MFKNQYMRKLILLRYICRNVFSPFKITLKLTFLFQLFQKFRENVIWPMKAKSTIYAKIFFGEMLSGLYIEIDDSAHFWRRHNIFQKNIYLSGENFRQTNFCQAKSLFGKIFVIYPKYKKSYKKNSYRDTAKVLC